MILTLSMISFVSLLCALFFLVLRGVILNTIDSCFCYDPVFVLQLMETLLIFIAHIFITEKSLLGRRSFHQAQSKRTSAAQSFNSIVVSPLRLCKIEVI